MTTKLMLGVAVAALLYPGLAYPDPTDLCLGLEVPTATYSFLAEAGPAFPGEDLVEIDVQVQECIALTLPPNRVKGEAVESEVVAFFFEGQEVRDGVRINIYTEVLDGDM